MSGTSTAVAAGDEPLTPPASATYAALNDGRQVAAWIDVGGNLEVELLDLDGSPAAPAYVEQHGVASGFSGNLQILTFKDSTFDVTLVARRPDLRRLRPGGERGADPDPGSRSLAHPDRPATAWRRLDGGALERGRGDLRR